MSFRSLLIAALLSSVTFAPVQADVSSGAYLAGRTAASDGDFADAARYYTQALMRDPANPVLRENVVLAQLSLGQVDRAAPVARQMEADSQASQISHMALVADEGAQGQFENLLGRVAEKRGVGPLVDGLLNAWALIGIGEPEEAIAAFDEVAKEKGLKGFAQYHKALSLALGGEFAAADAILSSEDSGGFAQTRRGAMARIEILSQMQRNDEGIKLLDDLFGQDLDPGLSQMREALAKGETLPFTHVTSVSDGLAEVFFTIATALGRDAEPDYVLLYSRVAEHLRPDHVDAILLSANLLERLQKYDLAVQTYKRVSAEDPSFHAAEMGRAEALRRAGKVDAAIEVLEALARDYPSLPSVQSGLADSLRQQDRFDEAEAVYDRALALYDTPDAGQWFLYYARAITRERQDKWDAAEADFRKALDLNPDQPQVLNYLGYSLVEQQVKLDEALDMIQRAVDAEPSSGYIVDSLGWVFYRLGRYDEAVVQMERAVMLMPVDPVVNDHLGDVLWAVGREREARFQWKRALSFITEDSDLEEVKPDRIRRKLEVGLDMVLSEEGAPPLKVANDG